jgi:hypothetical protein
MAQASQALNLCRATAEFSGSTEQVEGEKLLLISSKVIVISGLTNVFLTHLITLFRPEKASSYQ